MHLFPNEQIIDSSINFRFRREVLSKFKLTLSVKILKLLMKWKIKIFEILDNTGIIAIRRKFVIPALSHFFFFKWVL